MGFRPYRVGLLVRRDSIEDVAWAATAQTHLWGGLSNPIVSVGDSADDAVRLLRTLRADVVGLAGEDEPTPAQKSALETYRRDFPLPRMGREPFEFRGHSLPFADMRIIARHYHEQLTHLDPGDGNSIRVAWDEDDYDALHSVLFGRYRRDNVGQNYSDHYDLGLKARRVSPAQAFDAAGPLLTPIELTLAELRPLVYRPQPAATVVVVGEITDPETLLLFWNLRATGVTVALWPQARHAGLEARSRDWFDRVAKHAQRIKENARAVVVAANSPPQIPNELKSAAEVYGVELSSLPTAGIDWADPRFSAQTWATESNRVLASLEKPEGASRPKLIVGLPTRPFSMAKAKGLGLPKWLVTVSGFRGFEYADHTFDIPAVPELTAWASDEITGFEDVRLQDDGISVSAGLDDISIELRLVHEAEVFRQILASAGLTAAVSPAGEAARQMVSQLGGLMSARPLRLPGLRNILVREGHWYTFEQAVAAIEDDGSFRIYHNSRRQSAADTFRTMVKRGAFQVALHLTCPECRVTSPHRADGLRERIACPRCSSEFALASHVETGVWKYQPSGFFATAKTHGSVPVVLAMMALAEPLFTTSPSIVTSHDVRCDQWEEQDAEFDFGGLWRSESGAAVMAIGESKGRGRGPRSSITRAEVDRLIAISDAVRATGVECYVILSTTRETFHEHELEIIQSVIDDLSGDTVIDPDCFGEVRTPVLYTADYLDCYGPYQSGRDPALPIEHPRGLGQIAINTVAEHFGIPRPGRLDRTPGKIGY